MVGVVAGKSSENVNYVDILKKVYPVGAIYMSLTDTNPSLLFGGAWEQIEDVFLYAGKVGDANYAPGKTGGEKTHKLSTTEIPTGFVTNVSAGSAKTWDIAKSSNSITSVTQTKNSSGGKAHNNMPPFLAVYMWKRVE